MIIVYRSAGHRLSPAGACGRVRTVFACKLEQSTSARTESTHEIVARGSCPTPPGLASRVRRARLESRAGADGGRATGFQARRNRGACRADRALSRFAALAGPDGLHLPAGNRAGGALGESKSERQGRCRREGGREPAVGREREVAGRLPAGPRADGPETRLDAEAGRRVPCRPESGARCRTAAAQSRRPVGKPQVDRAAESHRRGGRTTANSDQDRAGAAGGHLRAGLQPDRRLRHLGLSCLSALLLAAVSGLVSRRLPGGRLRLGRGPRGRGCDFRRLQLGARRRQHQREQGRQHRPQLRSHQGERGRPMAAQP